MQLIPMNDRQPGIWLERKAGQSPNQVFLIFPAEELQLTYASAFDAGLRHATFMRSELGLQRGDNVALMLPNGSRWAKAWFGCVLGGMVDVGIHPDLSGLLLAHQLRAARVKAVFCDAATARKVVDAVAAPASNAILKSMVISDSADTILLAAAKCAGIFVASLAAAEYQAPAAHAPRGIQDVMSIRFTSGTTGPAKAAVLTMSQVAVWADYMVQLMKFTAGDRVYAPYPLHHHLASIMGIVGALRAGGSCIVDRQFSASQFWNQCIKHGATLGLILDPVVNILLKTPPSPQDQAHKVRRLYIARPNKAFEKRFATKLQTAFALTEGSVLTYLEEGDEIDSPQCVGRPNPHFDVRVFNDIDEDVAVGEKGEVVFRPFHPFTSMSAYYEDPANTVKACRNLWFHTGDVGSIDAKGYVYFYERMGDTIRRRGVNIPSFHIEEAALAFPGVAEAVAVAVPAEVGEFEAKLCILEASPGAVSPEALIRWMCKQLPREMVPRFLEIKKAFSRTITQKVIKHELRAEGVTPESLVTDQWLDE